MIEGVVEQVLLLMVVVAVGNAVIADGSVGRADIVRAGIAALDMVGRCSADMRGGGGGIPEVVMRPVGDKTSCLHRQQGQGSKWS